MGVSSVRVCLCAMRIWLCRGQKRTLDSVELELQISYELPCGYWDSNLGLLEKQSALTAEPFLQAGEKLCYI